jgi:hypothetical protein
MFARPARCTCRQPLLLPWYDGDRICMCGTVWYAREPLTIEQALKDRRRREPRLPSSGRDSSPDANI